MQRLLLRTGCVKVLDSELEETLKKRRRLISDKEIRGKCVRAVKGISEISGLSVFDLDDIFWALGRSCCNDRVLCRDEVCSKVPCTFNEIVDLKVHDRCVLERYCIGSRDSNYLDFWEPKVTTEFY